ncbi:hypothetical protein ACROYT_G015696 [Oculina patagonica]
MSTGCKRNCQIKIDGHEIEKIEQFSYLGSVIDVQGGADADVKTRIGKARQAFIALKPVWRSKRISLKTKLRLFNSNVKTVLLYGSESWKTTQDVVKKLRVFIHKCLRIILGIRWPQKISDLEVRNICKQEDIMVSLTRRRWSWIGHVLRKDSGDVAKEGLFWTPEGKRARGRPRTTWRRSAEKELKSLHLTWNGIRKATQDRSRWRETVEALCIFEFLQIRGVSQTCCQQFYEDKLPKAPSDPRGAGVCAFASRDVFKGDVICEYEGEIISLEEAKERVSLWSRGEALHTGGHRERKTPDCFANMDSFKDKMANMKGKVFRGKLPLDSTPVLADHGQQQRSPTQKKSQEDTDSLGSTSDESVGILSQSMRSKLPVQLKQENAVIDESNRSGGEAKGTSGLGSIAIGQKVRKHVDERRRKEAEASLSSHSESDHFSAGSGTSEENSPGSVEKRTRQCSWMTTSTVASVVIKFIEITRKILAVANTNTAA